MAVERELISTWEQAQAYAQASAQAAAKGVCPSATSVYSALAASAAARHPHLSIGGQFDRDAFLEQLELADVACQSAPDWNYVPPTSKPTYPEGPMGPPLPPGGVTPSPSGSSMWLWLLLGGGALYLLFGGKKKGKK